MRVKKQMLTVVSFHAPNKHRFDCDCMHDAFWTKLNLRLLARCPLVFTSCERDVPGK